MPEINLDDLLDDQNVRWSNGSRRLVEEYLVESPWLRGDAEALLDLIVHEILLRQRVGEEPRPDEYARRFPDLEPQLRIHFAIHAALDSHVAPDHSGDIAESAAPETPTTSVGRFELRRFHARGGLGEVFVARDGELPREVAFKRLQPRHAQDANSLARFVREAEITSRLEHPSIVPVYGLLHDEDGRPGYAMRLIRGESMSVAIERLHNRRLAPQGDRPAPPVEGAADSRPPPGTQHAHRDGKVGEANDSAKTASPVPRLLLRQLLGRFVAACQAVAYAHSQGVVHRDLTPANIMLGPFGETLVIDWGLARDLSAPRGDIAPASAPAHKRLLAETQAETQAGDLLGTPMFMSPEQAAGDWDRVGPASDVYSLGATLYTLLTGMTPFADTAPQTLLGRISQGDFPPPRQRRPDVPPALEAVCVKAMALRPDNRYATAQELSDDIDRWLADEPVTARRTPWLEATLRFFRRHPAWPASGTAGLVVAAITLTLLQYSYVRTRKAELASQHRQFREAAAVFGEALGQAETGDPHAASASYRSAIALLEPLVNDDVGARTRLAVCFNNLANLQLEVGDLRAAEDSARRAVDELDRLLRDDPDNSGHRHVASAACRKLGVVLARTDRVDESEEALQRAIELLTPNVIRPDARHEHIYFLAQVYFTRGEFMEQRGSTDRAEDALREAVELTRKAIARANEPLDGAPPVPFPEYRRLLARCFDSLGRLHAVPEPGSASYPAEAQSCRLELARQQMEAGRSWLDKHVLPQAQSAFEESLDLLLADATADHDLLVAGWRGLADVHRRAGRAHLAEQALERARQVASDDERR